jgi:sugar/nucleoside kinase (ribokinase family)
MVEDARLLTLDLYGGKERVEAARLARLAGRPVVAGDVRDPDHPVLPYTTVAIASGPELKAGTTLLPEEFARAAQAVGTGQVIVTQGKREVLVFDADGAIWEVQPPHIEVVDTTGAGDAFRAGVIFGLLSGRPLVECAALGASAGSINVGRVGAASNPPSLEEAERLAAKLECRRCDG